MIPADLLDQLREKDPGTYHAYGIMLAACGIVEESPMSEAWLLYCLMQAIRARVGWGYQITSFGLPVIANVYNRREYTTGRGDTEAEALGWAYLEATEAIRQ